MRKNTKSQIADIREEAAEYANKMADYGPASDAIAILEQRPRIPASCENANDPEAATKLFWKVVIREINEIREGCDDTPVDRMEE